MEQRHAEQYPDHYTDEDKEPVHEPCTQLGFLVQVLFKVVLEEQIDGRHGGACQQEVFGNLVDVDFGKGDERPVAKEQNDEQVDPARESQQQPDGENCYRAGHHGGVIMGNSIPRAHERSG